MDKRNFSESESESESKNENFLDSESESESKSATPLITSHAVHFFAHGLISLILCLPILIIILLLYFFLSITMKLYSSVNAN